MAMAKTTLSAPALTARDWFSAGNKMFRAIALTFLVGAAAQQPEQAHLSLTGHLNELSLDFMHHDPVIACNSSVGVQIGTTPDFTGSSFVPAYACTDFSAEESAP